MNMNSVKEQMFEKLKGKGMEYADDVSFLRILFRDVPAVAHSLVGITDMLGMRLQQYHELDVVACKYGYELRQKVAQIRAVAAFQFEPEIGNVTFDKG